jgi:DNA repair photolyase
MIGASGQESASLSPDLIATIYVRTLIRCFDFLAQRARWRNSMSTFGPNSKIIGRGSQIAPPNRFERTWTAADYEQLTAEDLADGEQKVSTQYFADETKSIIAENDSPDVGFRFSINPYRGCEHGCAYCYARPGHEFLGLNAGLDFETKIFVKHGGAALLREELGKPAWRGDESIMISGVTDCYQPAERKFRITRSLLEVLLEARQACALITKNALVVRDLDLLAPLAEMRLARVMLSITTLDHELARALEPRTSPPAKKLDAIRALAEAGVPVGIMVAPIIPGLTDNEVPSILAAAADAGARTAGYVLLRLPFAVRPIFEDWLARNRPKQYDRVISRIRTTREGGMYQTAWGVRQTGTGEYAEQIAATVKVFKRKYGLDGDLPPYDFSLFRPPKAACGQMRMF